MSSDSLWQAITTSAVLGTQRRPVQISAERGALGDLLLAMQNPGENGQADAAAEDLLLGALAAATVYRRAGLLPQAGVPLRFAACPADAWPRCTNGAALFLQVILAGQQRALLPEWIELAAAHRQRIPEEQVEAVLSHKRLVQPCRRALSQALDERGRWLARQTRAIYQQPPPLGFGLRGEETFWHEGSAAQRAEFLSDLRLHDAQRALDLLAESWPQESPAAKARLLKALEETLCAADEPFLETALDDRSQEVRAAAAGLLARLPESGLVARMTARARELLAWKPGLLRSGLAVTPPQDCDATLQRAGIDARPPAGSQLGQQAGLLAQVLALVPPGVWSAGWNRRPAQILDAARKHEWEAALLWGWETAAVRLHDSEWLEALMAHRTRGGEPQRAAELFAGLPDEAQERLVIAMLRDNPSLSYDQPPSISLSACRHAWGPELTQAVTTAICTTLQKGKLPPWRWEKLLRDIPPYFHPDLLAECAEQISAALARRGTDEYAASARSTISALADTLRFRHEMRQSFRTQP